MKKLFFVALMVMTFNAMANENPGFAISKDPSRNVYNLIYVGKESRSQTYVTILDSNGNVIRSHRYQQVNGYKLPINFEGMRDGRYTIQLRDGDEVFRALINHELDKPSAAFHVLKLSGEDNKYLVNFIVTEPTFLAFSIRDKSGRGVYDLAKTFVGTDAMLLNIAENEGPFEFEVSDSYGRSYLARK